MVPPLRDRMDDVPELARYFLARFAAEEGKRITSISHAALELITAYSWPGNVRQLENAVFRAVVLCDGSEIGVDEFPQIAAHVDGFKASVPAAPANVERRVVINGPVVLGAEKHVPQTIALNGSGRNSLGIPAVDAEGEIRSLEAIEADMIRLALGRYRGHMTEVAKRLNIGRSTLYRKMKDYGLEDPAERLPEAV
jgi:DNA-binding NtrC family response regulator